MEMTYAEETALAERVARSLRSHGTGLIQIDGRGYSVHTHGHDLRFNQRTDLGYGEVGRFLIVSIIGHLGGWVMAEARRPPGEYHDERAARAAQLVVRRELVRLGIEVGTAGREGTRLSAAQIEREVEAALAQVPREPLAPATRRPRRAARRAR